MKKAVIILPTYNEAGTIEELIRGIFDQSKKNPSWEMHVVVVDSDSKDKTQNIVNKLIEKYPHLHLVKTKREGLGKAYVEGFLIALEKLNPYLIFEMDADLSHDPKNIPDFLHAIEKGADFVIGTRYIKGGSIPKNWGIHRKFLSIVGNYTIRLGFMKPQITDWTTGYRAMKSWIVKEAISYIKNYSGYVFQVAMIDFALKHNARITATPINFKDRSYGESKLNSGETIIQTLFYVFTHSSFVKFIIVGSIGFIIDFSLAYFFIHLIGFAKPNANALSSEVAIISNFLFNNFWSFSHKRITGGLFSYLKKLLAFNLTSSGSIAIQWIGMYMALLLFGDKVIKLTEGFSFPSWIMYKIIIIVLFIIPYSYFVYNKIIWKSGAK